MVDTKKVTDRRTLQFSSMKDIVDDMTYLASGDPPRTTGNWTAGQIVQHVGMLIAYSIDDFPGKAPLHMRIVGRLIKNSAMRNPLRPGLSTFAFLEPDEHASWDDSVKFLQDTVARLDRERMEKRSPLFGRLSHDQWEQLHCRHAEMHFSFMHPA